MPIKKAAIKALKSSRKKQLENLKIKSEIKTLNRNFESLLNAKEIDKARKLLKELVRKLDKALNKGVIHKNTASRKKSRLMKKLQTSSTT